MNDNGKPDTTMSSRAREREYEVKTEVASLFRHCSASANPVLAFSRASAKVGYLARDGVRDNLFYLASALNEQKHAVMMQRLGKTAEAREHAIHRDRYLRYFATPVRRELLGPRPPPSTPELRARIHRNGSGIGIWTI